MGAGCGEFQGSREYTATLRYGTQRLRRKIPQKELLHPHNRLCSNGIRGWVLFRIPAQGVPLVSISQRGWAPGLTHQRGNRFRDISISVRTEWFQKLGKNSSEYPAMWGVRTTLSIRSSG